MLTNLICAGLLLVLLQDALVEAAGHIRKTNKPHIIVMLVDDLGWGDTGYHGAPFPTPSIDRLAAEGVTLENFYVQPMCTPTRAALLTGRYPIRYGFQHDVLEPLNPTGLPLNETLISQVLRDNGYTTHALGKWHLGYFKNEYTPTYRGFDTFLGFYNSQTDHFNNVRDWHGGYLGLDLRRQTEPLFNKEQVYSTHMYTREAIDIIHNHDQSKPMFMYLAYQACHGPNQAPQIYLDRCANIKGNGLRKSFCGMTLAIDEAMNNVSIALEAAGMSNDTLFVFLTDNGAIPVGGGGSNWPLRGSKFTYFEGGVRVPAFVHGNMLSTSVLGTKNNMLMHVTDVFPTILEAAEIDYISLNELDGVSAWKALNTKTPPRQQIRAEVLINIDSVVTPQSYSIIVDDMKLIYGHQQYYSWYNSPNGLATGTSVYPNGMTLLFNISADPYEHVDLSGTHPDIVAALNSTIDKYRAGTMRTGVWPEDRSATPERYRGYWTSWLSPYNATAPELLAPWEDDKAVLGTTPNPTIVGFQAPL